MSLERAASAGKLGTVSLSLCHCNRSAATFKKSRQSFPSLWAMEALIREFDLYATSPI